MGKFSLEIAEFAKRAVEKADAVTRMAITDLTTDVVERSPVGDAKLWQSPPPKGYVGGRFRANWQLGVESIPDGVLPDIDPSSASANASLKRVIGAIPSDAAGRSYYLTNNLPYAERLEYGWSTQAPAGMVAIAVVRWRNIVDDAVNNLRNGDSSMAAGFKAYPI
ncbi:hypothetical protein [Undibacterium sp. TJN19]|uniref:hypothetical protein n=1 Tax=Undibacterium sp. TJN19 TaxID=3413055 RepID=UPI003BF403A1